MLNMFSFFNFKKVFGINIFTSIFFFCVLFFLTKPNESSTITFISLFCSFFFAILFLITYMLQNRTMACEFAKLNYDGDDFSLLQLLEDVKGYAYSFSLLILIFVVAYNLIIPQIGYILGSPFQVSFNILSIDFDFNVLTLIINMFFIVWFFLGTAQIVILEASFLETFKYTISFIFDNFLKMIPYVLFIVFMLFIFNLTLVETYSLNQYVAMPLKVIVFAYLLGLCNSMTIKFLANNLSLEDE